MKDKAFDSREEAEDNQMEDLIKEGKEDDTMTFDEYLQSMSEQTRGSQTDINLGLRTKLDTLDEAGYNKGKELRERPGMQSKRASDLHHVGMNTKYAELLGTS